MQSNNFLGKKMDTQRYSAGFTLIELIVVITIFAFVVLVSATIFGSAVQQQKRLSRDQQFLNQANAFIDTTSRTIREAAVDSTGDCLGGDYRDHHYLLTSFDAATGFYQGIRFISSDNVCHEFFLDTDGVLKSILNNDISPLITPSDSHLFTLIAVRFVINGDKDLVSDPIDSEDVQPRVTIYLSAELPGDAGITQRLFQTTVSLHNLNKISSTSSQGNFQASFLGVTGEDIVGSLAVGPDGTSDYHVSFSGAKAMPVKVVVSSDAGDIWETPLNEKNWIVFINTYDGQGNGDVWFDPQGDFISGTITFTYGDQTTDQANLSTCKGKKCKKNE